MRERASVMELAGPTAIDKLRGAGPRPFYVCHGEYEFLNKEFAAEALKLLVPDAAERAGVTQRFDWSEGEDAVDAWSEAAGSLSLFGGGQLLIVDNAHVPALKRKPNPAAKAKNEDKFTNWISYRRFERVVEDPLDGVHTIFLCHEPLNKVKTLTGRRSDKFIQRLYPLFSDKGAVVEFAKLWDNQIVAWINARLMAQGLRIGNETAEFLLAWAGSDLRHLDNEIQKLATYLGDGAAVTEDHVRTLITSCEDQFVYLLIDTIMEGRGDEALRLLDMALVGSTQPLFVIAAFSGVMRDMWQARYLMDRGYFKHMPERYNKMKTLNEAARVGEADRRVLSPDGKCLADRSPYIVFHAVRRARLLPLKTIENIMRRLMDIDCQLKGIMRPKKGTDEILLHQLVSDLTFVVRKAAAPRQRARR